MVERFGFFSFRNDETLCCFEWLLSRQLSRPLVDKAFETADQGEFYGICEPTARDAVKFRLAELVEEEIGKAQISAEAGMVFDDDYRELFTSLIVGAIQNVDAQLVAEALLRHEGKWHDSGPTPDLFPVVR